MPQGLYQTAWIWITGVSAQLREARTSTVSALHEAALGQTSCALTRTGLCRLVREGQPGEARQERQAEGRIASCRARRQPVRTAPSVAVQTDVARWVAGSRTSAKHQP